MSKNPSIKCRVETCRHNCEGMNCELGAIEVTGIDGSCKCDCATESMCASYDKKCVTK